MSDEDDSSSQKSTESAAVDPYLFDRIWNCLKEQNFQEIMQMIENGNFNVDDSILTAVLMTGNFELFKTLTTRVYNLRCIRDDYTRDHLLNTAIGMDNFVYIEYLLDNMWTLSELTFETARPIANSLEKILERSSPEMTKMIALFLDRGWRVEWHISDIITAAARHPLEVCRPLFEAANPADLSSQEFFTLLKRSLPENLWWFRNHWEITAHDPEFFTFACYRFHILKVLLSKKDGKTWWLYPYDYTFLAMLAVTNTPRADEYISLFFESVTTPAQEADLRRLVEAYPRFDVYLLEKSCGLEF